MSHAANNYVKKLKRAPNGEEITIQEKAILWYLADCHSEEAGGIAWPSVKTLAEASHVSERQIRRIVAEVERKGIIGRIAQSRENGSCRSNDYYFVALGYEAKKPSTALLKTGGKSTKNGAKPVKKGVKPEAPTLTPMTGGGCHPRQEAPDTDDRGTLTPTTALEAPLETPGEAPEESPLRSNRNDGDEGDGFSETTSKAKTARANVSQPGGLTPLREIFRAAVPGLAPSAGGKWDEFKAELVRQIGRLPEKLREEALVVYDDCLRDTTLESEACDGDDLVPTWTICSGNPRETQSALAALHEPVKAALWKAAKGQVHVRVSGGGE